MLTDYLACRGQKYATVTSTHYFTTGWFNIQLENISVTWRHQHDGEGLQKLIRCNNLILVNRQCLQYVFYSLFSLRKDRICMWKGHQNNRQTKNSTAPGPRLPVLKFLDPSLLCTHGPWVGRFLYSATPAVTRILGFSRRKDRLLLYL